MKTVRLPSGQKVPSLGLGTWQMGDDPAAREKEIATIRLALDLGVGLIDTAEMYGEGRSEALVGEALQGRRQEAFIVSKVYPQNASGRSLNAACERSLTRLKTERIDLYLLHWRGDVPLGETLDGFQSLQQAGKIAQYGVSNLDVADLEELWALPGGTSIATDQVLYNLVRRGVEWRLLPWLRAHQIPVMAYSPVEQARLLQNSKLIGFARRNGTTPAQVALAWLLSQEDVIVIPKTSNPERLRENVKALELTLESAQRAELNRLFPPPSGPGPLEML